MSKPPRPTPTRFTALPLPPGLALPEGASPEEQAAFAEVKRAAWAGPVNLAAAVERFADAVRGEGRT